MKISGGADSQSDLERLRSHNWRWTSIISKLPIEREATIGSTMDNRKDLQYARQRFRKALPEALLLTKKCLDEGMMLVTALDLVNEHMISDVSFVFRPLLNEISLGLATPEALRRSVERAALPEYTRLVNAILEAMEHNLSMSDIVQQQYNILVAAPRADE